MALTEVQLEGLQDDLDLIIDFQDPADQVDRLDVIGNHATMPKCRNCPKKEKCLEEGTICKASRVSPISLS